MRYFNGNTKHFDSAALAPGFGIYAHPLGPGAAIKLDLTIHMGVTVASLERDTDSDVMSLYNLFLLPTR